MGCAFYLAVAPIGIAHICFVLGILILIKDLITKTNDKSIMWIFILLVFSFNQISIGADWKSTVNNVSSMLMYVIVLNIFNRSSYYRIIDVSKCFLKFTTTILVIECSIRFILSFPSGINLYNLKFHSFMFLDTNFCGLLILVILCLIKYLEQFQNQKGLKKIYFINIILLILTLSRAAILGFIAFSLLFYHINNHNFLKKIIFRISIFIIIGIIFGGILYKMAIEDDSFRSKLYILGLVEENKNRIKDIIVLGIGLGRGEKFLGIYPHNVFLLYIIETGIVGLALKAIFLLYILIRTHWKGLTIVIPYLISLQSATGYTSHYFYVSLALISLFEKIERRNLYKNNIYGTSPNISMYCHS